MTWRIFMNRVCSWHGSLYLAVAAKLQYLFRSDPDPWHGGQSNWLQKIFCNCITSFAQFWHGYLIHGIEDIQKLRGNTLLVGYHSRCTVDLFYLFCTLRCNVLASYLFFTVQATRYFLPMLNIIPSKSLDGGSTEEGFVSALADRPEPLMLLPGGVWECLKQSPDRLKVLWKETPGFARVIHKHPDRLGKHTQVFAFYTRNCEKCLWSTDFWHDFSGKWSAVMYDSFKGGNLLVMPPMLLLMISSMGFALLPNPIKVETYLSVPMTIEDDESPEVFAERVRLALQQLIDDVEARPVVDNRSLLHRLAMIPYGAFTLGQNAVLFSLVAAIIVTTYPPLIAYSLLRALRNSTPEKRE